MSDSQRTNYAEDNFNYDPSKPAAMIAGVLYGLLSLALFVRLIHRKNWWGLCLPIGTSAFSTGFFLRYGLAVNPFSNAFLVSSQILIVVSPATFLAFNYIVYGRLMQAFVANKSRYSLIRPSIVARIFVISDITTFIAQGAGGSMESDSDHTSANIGRIVLLAGLIAQTVSYLFFILLLVHSHWRISKDETYDRHNFPWRLVHLLYISSAFITVRGIYRTIELSQGDEGYLVTHEVFLYLFDTYPLFFATVIYAPFWPGKFIEIYSSRDDFPLRLDSMNSA